MTCAHKGKTYETEVLAQKGADGSNKYRTDYKLAPSLCADCCRWFLKSSQVSKEEP